MGDPVTFDAARIAARALDAADPLARFRSQFAFTEPRCIYLNGNSLGRMPVAAGERVRTVLEKEWAGQVSTAWSKGWMEILPRISGKLATLIGAAPHEVMLCDTVSINLFKLLDALLKAIPSARTVYFSENDFPTDRYVARAVGAANAPRITVREFSTNNTDPDAAMADLAAKLDAGPGILVLSHVDFRTSLRWDPAVVNALAAKRDILVLWDLSHSAGAIPIDVRHDGMRAAVGCTYKYLNGGPGAPAFLFAEETLLANLRNPIPGWLGNASPFAMGPVYESAPMSTRFVTGTPPILTAVAAEAGIDIALEAGAAQAWEKHQAQLRFLRELLLGAAYIEGSGCTIVSPTRDHGGHLAIHVSKAAEVAARLAQRGVIVDHRPVDLLRFAIAPLYNTFEDLVDAAEVLREVLVAN